jgi:TRAP-type C4-dicarboxylate transport system permease small subunit
MQGGNMASQAIRRQDKIQQTLYSITKAITWLCGAFLILMMAHVGLDIALKLIFNAPLEGTLETVSYYYMVSIVFLALPFVEMRREHVAVDLFFLKFPKRLQVYIYVTGMMIAAAYYGLFCYQTTLDALKATQQRETVMANFLFYVWPSRWALSIGSGMLVLLLALHAVKALMERQIAADGDLVEALS